MPYEKLNLKDGHVLTAAHIAHLEKGIEDAENTAIQGATTGEMAPPIVPEASGALVSVPDAAARDALKVVFTINPNTTGVSEMNMTHTGKNIVSHLDYVITQYHANTIITEDVIDVKTPSGYDYGKIPVFLKGGATYTLVIDWEVYGRAEDATDYTTCSYRIDKLQSTATHVNSNGNLLKRFVRAYTVTEDVQANILWYPNFGSKVKACSRSRVMLLEGTYTAETAPAFEPCVKQTMTVVLPETVYGGTLDGTSGLLTVTHGADGGELSEPHIIEIDQQTLKMFEGHNTVWSDVGDTSITYLADTKLYIDNKFDALQSAILALGANV